MKGLRVDNKRPRPTASSLRKLEFEIGLDKLGFHRYEQIAAWMRSDIERVEQSLGQKGRINQENWIEQAQILTKGGETHYASRRARGETADASRRPTKASVIRSRRRPLRPGRRHFARR